ncbi:hypothetical protein O5166_25845, partial [Escherichia coli]|nr:hypothetical protein [Escherichia coli]
VPYEPLFGLAPGGVYRATDCYQPRGSFGAGFFGALIAGIIGGIVVHYLKKIPVHVVQPRWQVAGVAWLLLVVMDELPEMTLVLLWLTILPVGNG